LGREERAKACPRTLDPGVGSHSNPGEGVPPALTSPSNNPSWPGPTHGCPAGFLLFKTHDVDSTRGPTFGDVTGHEEVNALPHDNSVFHSMLKLVSWDAFNAAVEQHATRVHARGFSDKSHLVAMLYTRFAGASSLREIEAGLHSHASRLYHLGARPPRRSPTVAWGVPASA
jgi:hypothetical protein